MKSKRDYSKINISKTFKWVSVIFLSLALIAPCVYMALEIDGVLSSTKAENGASPEIFNALRQYTTSDNQSDNEYWRYEFAEDFSAPDWKELTSKDSWGAWSSKSLGYRYASMPSNGNIWFQNKENTMDSLGIPALAYKFIAPYDGNITLYSTATHLNTSTANYNCRIRVTKNGENIYPESGWKDVVYNEPIEFSGLDIELKTGDLLRFEITVNNHLDAECVAKINWNPYFMLQAKDSKYTQTADIFNNLTGYMYDFFKAKQTANMDAESSNPLKGASDAIKKSKYGTFSASDVIYDGQIIPSSDESLWKFGVLSEGEGYFSDPTDEFFVSGKVENGYPIISWNKGSNGKITAVEVYYNNGTYNKFTTPLNFINLPLLGDATQFKVQLSSGDKVSEIFVMTYKDGEWSSHSKKELKPDYLNEQTVYNEGKISKNIILKNSDISSNYEFSFALNNATNAEDLKYQRSLRFNAAAFENMRFGFTAPCFGNYQISAPIEVETESAEVKYGLYLTDKNGIISCIQKLRTYTEKGDFCNIQLNLNKDDTVWFDVVADKNAVINIGIPKAVCTTYCDDTESGTAYSYRALEYFESSYSNGLDYKIYSLAENSKSVWNFGYFNNPVTENHGTYNYDSLGIARYSVGGSAENLVKAFTPYELLRNGIYYNTLLYSEKSDGSIVTFASGQIGVMYPSIGNTTGTHTAVGLPKRCKGISTTIGYTKLPKNNEPVNIGVYMKFTAPIGGQATLRLTDDDVKEAAFIGNRYLVIKNGVVSAIYKNSIPAGTTLDLGEVNTGDTIILVNCYTTGKSMAAARCLGNPSITLTGKRYNVSLDKNVETVVENKSVQMPTKGDKIGARLVGWKNNTENQIFEPGDSFEITQNTDFEAIYEYYGDLNGDDAVTTVDLSIMRKYLLDNEYIGENGDVNTDGNISINDLVRMKKWLSGITTILGQ